MMKLFGLDIPALVRGGIQSAGGLRSLTLIKVIPGTRTPAQLTAGTNPTEASYLGEGFVEDGAGTRNVNGHLTRYRKRTVSILGASLPAGIVPEPSDKITLDGSTYRIVQEGVKTDPAEALFVCEVGKP